MFQAPQEPHRAHGLGRVSTRAENTPLHMVHGYFASKGGGKDLIALRVTTTAGSRTSSSSAKGASPGKREEIQDYLITFEMQGRGRQ